MPQPGKFLSAPAVEADVVVARDVFATHAPHSGKFTAGYAQANAVITLPKAVMTSARLKDGERVEVRTAHGAVVVAARQGTDDVAWMPNSPWANALIPAPDGNALPLFKGFRAELWATQKDITTLPSLLEG